VTDPSTPAVRFRGVTQRFLTPAGDRYTAVEAIDFEIPPGMFVSLVGPSGCGKSTILHIAAGLTPPAEGRVEIGGAPLEGINRRAGYMFQQDALLPWKTVLDNIVLGLRLRGASSAELSARGREWIRRVGLDGFGGHFPHQLSGGMRKRAAMAQQWIVSPDILLMDEPFSALDVHTRQRMETELLDLWSAERKTILFVTHDLEEAIAISDRVVLMSAGPASRVFASYEIPLERPRGLVDIRTDARFIEIYRRIWSDLRVEVLNARS